MIKLSPFTIEDTEILIGWFDTQESLVQFSGSVFTWPLTEAQLAKHLMDANRLIYKVIDEESSLVIGHGEIVKVPDEPPKLTCLIIGNTAFRGKGLGRELIRQLIALAFNELSADAVQLYVYDWNRNAYELYRSLGFAVNSDKTLTTTVNGQTWVALNMVIKRTNEPSAGGLV